MKVVIGERLRALRAIKKYTVVSVAQALGVSPTGYAKIESGQSNVTIERLEQIAAFFEVSVADLLAEETLELTPEEISRKEIKAEINTEMQKLHKRMNKIETMLQIMLKEIIRKKKKAKKEEKD